MHKTNSSLYVCSDIPYPDNTGGRKITLGKILELSETRNVKVCCFNFNNADSKSAKDFLESRGIEFNVINPSGGKFVKILIFFLSIFNLLPFYSVYIRFSNLSKIIRTLASTGDEVFLDNIFAYPVVNFNSFSKASVLFHNNESRFFLEVSKTSTSKSKRLFFWFESLKVSILENKIIKHARTSGNIDLYFLTLSDLRSYRLPDCAENDFAFINSNKIYVPLRVTRDVDVDSPFFLFPGSIDFPPNLEGLLLIAKEYDSRNLDVKIIVTGKATENNKKLFDSYSNFVFVGLLPHEDLLKLYSKCLCVISPIISGSGIKIKNIESVLLGVDVLVTSFSNIGIPDFEKKSVTLDDPVDFVNGMVSIYSEFIFE